MAEPCPHPLEAHLDGAAIARPADPAALLSDLRFDIGLRAALAPSRSAAIWDACLAAAPAPRRGLPPIPWRPLATLAAAASLMAGVGTWSVASWSADGAEPAQTVQHRQAAPEIVVVAAVADAVVLP
ncbi:MAG: hypothetical protein RLZZ127_3222 [Planctomycetota bacterium]|jgi:hypothetical protein